MTTYLQIEKNSVDGGLLINNISDRLPVLAIFPKYLKSKTVCQMIRHRTSKKIAAFKIDLMKENWKEDYSDDPDRAYDAFLTTLTHLYDKHSINKVQWETKISGQAMDH